MNLSSHVSAALLVLVFCSGCYKENTPTAGTSDGASHGHEHDEHGHGAGPHDGTLADWGGGKYHVEFTVDHGKREAVVYVLGGDEKTPEPIAAQGGVLLLAIKDPSFQVELKSEPQSQDAPGKSSRFVGKHEKLGTVQEFAGLISGVIDGTPYVGEFKEEPHGSHKH